MDLSKPTRKALLDEMLAQVEKQLGAEQDAKLKKVLGEKQELIKQMIDELPHYVWPEPVRPSYFSSDLRRYYRIYLGWPSGWSGGMTRTEDPHPYIKSITLNIENSEPNEWSGYGSEIRLLLEIDHELGIEWFVSGKYDTERHKRYDLGLSTVMRVTVDSTQNLIADLRWDDSWKKTVWREVAIPADILSRYRELVRWSKRVEKPDFAKLGIPANALLFFRKVKFPDGKVMHIRLESGEDECWLFGRLLDRSGMELVSDYFRFFPASFALQYGDTLYEAIIREDKSNVKK